MNDSLAYMKKVTLFDGFTDAEMDILASAFKVRTVKPGTIICREGDAAPSFFIVVTGIVSVFKEISDTVRQRLATIGRNCMLGQVALIDHGKRSATLEAGSPAILLECSREDFDRLYNANSQFAYKVLDFIATDLSKRLRQANRKLEELLVNPGETISMIYDAFVEVGKAVHETGEYRATFMR